MAGHLLESFANRQRALFFQYKQSLKLMEFLVMADGGGTERATETTLTTCLFCSVKQNRKKPLIDATRSGGFTGNMVIIWRNATTANTTGVSQRLPIVSLIFSLSVRRKSVNLSSHDILAALSLHLSFSSLLISPIYL